MTPPTPTPTWNDDNDSVGAGDCSSDASKSSYSSTAEGATVSNETTSGSSSVGLGIAKSLSRHVLYSKLAVFGVISIVASVVGYGTYAYTHHLEVSSFESQFKDYAYEIGELVHHEAANIFGLVDSLASSVTSHAMMSEQRLPFATLPHFEVMGNKSNEISLALQVTFAPLVHDVDAWNAYTIENQYWLQQKHYVSSYNLSSSANPIHSTVAPMFQLKDGKKTIEDFSGHDVGPTLHAPVWQQAPSGQDPSIINFDLLSHPVFERTYHTMLNLNHALLSPMLPLEFLYGHAVQDDDSDQPHSFVLQPVYHSFEDQSSGGIAGLLVAVLPWNRYLSGLLPKSISGIIVVFHDTCGDQVTYQLDGRKATFLGHGDLSDPSFSDLVYTTAFDLSKRAKDDDDEETGLDCDYYLSISPSRTFKEMNVTNKPAIFSMVEVIVILLTASVFGLYDRVVTRRQNVVMATAKRSRAIVSSLFPKNVRDRILVDVENMALDEAKHGAGKKKQGGNWTSPTSLLKEFLGDTGVEQECFEPDQSKPIAEFYPNSTIMFADIAGFTSWSSVREPAQVFILLETIYQAFDQLAHHRRVFKVETIGKFSLRSIRDNFSQILSEGDCYVAVAGLPDPRKDHATVMARFARDCLASFGSLTKQLETTLGPDTSELGLRIGLHSGPVTAGVLRGEKGRFQLFGDTVNTASRIETTGVRNCIHISQETASCLAANGKQKWCIPREETIHAKGKGELTTFWLDFSTRSSAASSTQATVEINNGTQRMQESAIQSSQGGLDEKTLRLVSWNVEIFSRSLEEIIARRRASTRHLEDDHSKSFVPDEFHGLNPMEEIVEIIHLPEYQRNQGGELSEAEAVSLDPLVKQELFDFVETIAKLYNKHHFHNFSHASHVAMSVSKLLSRIIAPSDVLDSMYEDGDVDIKFALHDHTFGITSDPLTQFACLFASLIHDVDHAGVSNAILVTEGNPLAQKYENKSVLEQNSIDLAWDLLLRPQYDSLRHAICSTERELCRFRQLVVNCVMATDIADKELKVLRNSRWNTAFHSPSRALEPLRVQVNRKATIVLEHLIQASDVSHTMQHWHVYRHWNEQFFLENMQAYKDGRMSEDPSKNWYKGEIGFFDFYIIPLARKLKDCAVFGASSDEYLNYALKNREEWIKRGEEIVEEMIELFYTDYGIDLERQNETAVQRRVSLVRESSARSTNSGCSISVVDANNAKQNISNLRPDAVMRRGSFALLRTASMGSICSNLSITNASRSLVRQSSALSVGSGCSFADECPFDEAKSIKKSGSFVGLVRQSSSRSIGAISVPLASKSLLARSA